MSDIISVLRLCNKPITHLEVQVEIDEALAPKLYFKGVDPRSQQRTRVSSQFRLDPLESSYDAVAELVYHYVRSIIEIVDTSETTPGDDAAFSAVVGQVYEEDLCQSMIVQDDTFKESLMDALMANTTLKVNLGPYITVCVTPRSIFIEHMGYPQISRQIMGQFNLSESKATQGEWDYQSTVRLYKGDLRVYQLLTGSNSNTYKNIIDDIRANQESQAVICISNAMANEQTISNLEQIFGDELSFAGVLLYKSKQEPSFNSLATAISHYGMLNANVYEGTISTKLI